LLRRGVPGLALALSVLDTNLLDVLDRRAY
jgi:hypothetical protein